MLFQKLSNLDYSSVNVIDCIKRFLKLSHPDDREMKAIWPIGIILNMHCWDSLGTRWSGKQIGNLQTFTPSLPPNLIPQSHPQLSSKL